MIRRAKFAVAESQEHPPTRSLAKLLQSRARILPDKDAFLFKGEHGLQSWSNSETWTKACVASTFLRDKGISRGEHILCLALTVSDTVAITFGAWTLGSVPVQIGIPQQLRNRTAFAARIARIAERLDCHHVLASSSVVGWLSEELQRHPNERHLCLLDIEQKSCIDHCTTSAPCARQPDFFQLTSGSTGEPRCAVIPGDNLLNHLQAIHDTLAAPTSSMGVSWLPLYHDMGFIGGMLYPFWAGFPVCLLSPLDFRRRPYYWLQLLSELKATHTASPPSGYAIALHYADRAFSDGLDFSHLRCVMVGAEPISPQVVRDFTARFARCGLAAKAILPVYGLAEATVAATLPQPMQVTVYDKVHAQALTNDMAAIPSNNKTDPEFIALGTAISGTKLKVVNQQGLLCADRKVGEIWLQSATGMDRYYNNIQATEDAFAGSWLRTGDMGYLVDGQLFVTGRLKELIIVAGRNLLPAFIEQVVEQVDGVCQSAVAAVGIKSPQIATQRVVVVAETKQPVEQHTSLSTRILDTLVSHDLAVNEIRLVARGSLPRTTSGKICRKQIAQNLQMRALV